MPVRILLFFAALLLLTRCGKKIEEEHPEYVGEWLGINYAEYGDVQNITISESSHGKYSSAKAWTGFSGTVRIHGDKLHIGSHKFNIISAPEPVDTATDQNLALFYRAYGNPGCQPAKMKLEAPWLYARTTLTYYRVK